MPRLQTGHESAADNLQVDEARKKGRPEFNAQRRLLGKPLSLRLRWLPHGQRKPEGIARNRDRKRKMSREPVLADIHPVLEPALDHEPAQRPLHRA